MEEMKMKKILAALMIMVLLTGSAMACYEYNGIVCAVAGSTNIRSCPGLYGEIIGTLPKGEVCYYLSESAYDDRGVLWMMVDYDGTMGWVSEKYVETNGVRGNMDYYDHNTEGDSEYPVYDYGYDCSSQYISSYGTVVATGGDTNIRSWAGLEYSIVGAMPEGAAAVYKGSSSTDNRGVRWDYVDYCGVQGWVSSRYTTLY